MTGVPRKAQRFGPELWAERAGREWSLWDLWFSVVALVITTATLTVSPR